jgi:hypothetical protein
MTKISQHLLNAAIVNLSEVIGPANGNVVVKEAITFIVN